MPVDAPDPSGLNQGHRGLGGQCAEERGLQAHMEGCSSLVIFAEHGLTPQTHYIASTGVGGAWTRPDAKVFMDAYAVSGIVPAQVSYLSALDYLSPTHVYGVTFERGTAIAYRDRTHVILSGTASIDRHGRIVHERDMPGQLDHTIMNVEALLGHAGAERQDLRLLITYVRDPADMPEAERLMTVKFGNVPLLVVHAPVCRPGWLIEVEGLATVPSRALPLPAF